MNLTLASIQGRINNAAHAAERPIPRLLAVSKLKPASAIAELATQGQRAFGENYVQEAATKIAELGDLGLEWHIVGHLQSNKAELAAQLFDWVQSVDRLKLVAALAKYRRVDQAPLNLLIQVNVDDESSKYGCPPEQVEALAAAIAEEPTLKLRGLMAIPTPHEDLELRRPALRQMKALFDTLAARYPDIDTLSMGMSDDLEIAIAEGATMVRVGTALFGARPTKTEDAP